MTRLHVRIPAILSGTALIVFSFTVFVVAVTIAATATGFIDDGEAGYSLVLAALGFFILSCLIVWSSFRSLTLAIIAAVTGPPVIGALVAANLLFDSVARRGGYAAEQGMGVLVLPLLIFWSSISIPYWILVAWSSWYIKIKAWLRPASTASLGIALFLVGGLTLWKLRSTPPSREAARQSHNARAQDAGDSTLAFAVRHRSKELVEAYFVREAPSVDEQTLEDLVKDGDIEFLEFLASQAVLPLRVPSGRSLQIAVRRDDARLLRWLLDRGANVEAVNPDTGRTALMEAGYTGKRPLVELLLSRGAHPGVRDQAGRTAKQWSEDGGYGEITQILDRAPHPYILEISTGTPPREGEALVEP